MIKMSYVFMWRPAVRKCDMALIRHHIYIKNNVLFSHNPHDDCSIDDNIQEQSVFSQGEDARGQDIGTASLPSNLANFSDVYGEHEINSTLYFHKWCLSK
ncbi:hypothetical protein ACF0H5_009368 [Mactra antiquata]